jgi:hypothetical protein
MSQASHLCVACDRKTGGSLIRSEACRRAILGGSRTKRDSGQNNRESCQYSGQVSGSMPQELANCMLTTGRTNEPSQTDLRDYEEASIG